MNPTPNNPIVPDSVLRIVAQLLETLYKLNAADTSPDEVSNSLVGIPRAWSCGHTDTPYKHIRAALDAMATQYPTLPGIINHMLNTSGTTFAEAKEAQAFELAHLPPIYEGETADLVIDTRNCRVWSPRDENHVVVHWGPSSQTVVEVLEY